MMTSTNVMVSEKDIRNIGHTQFKDDSGMLSIICNVETANIEEILLRSILTCFGNEYVITNNEDFIWTDVEGKEVIDILFRTNLPPIR